MLYANNVTSGDFSFPFKCFDLFPLEMFDILFLNNINNISISKKSSTILQDMK